MKSPGKIEKRQKRKNKMLPYGSRKRGSKLHPHNECGICGESKPVKARERSRSRLIESARYSDEMADTHIMREAIAAGEVDADNWKKAAKTIQEIDPEGKRSLEILRRMKVDEAIRDFELRRKNVEKMRDSRLKRKRS